MVWVRRDVLGEQAQIRVKKNVWERIHPLARVAYLQIHCSPRQSGKIGIKDTNAFPVFFLLVDKLVMRFVNLIGIMRLATVENNCQ